jgi:hypothetical protein
MWQVYIVSYIVMWPQLLVGVAILCADNQASVDMILLVVYENNFLRRTNISPVQSRQFSNDSMDASVVIQISN